jgi:hypothetical protein
VRIRILKPSEGILDGVSLAQLVPGLIYEVEPPVGRYLIQIRSAEEIPASNSDLVVPFDDPPPFEELARGVSVMTEPQTAHDRERRSGTSDRRRRTRGDRRKR